MVHGTWVNCIYIHKKTTAFHVASFTEVTNGEQHYRQTSHAEFQPNRKISVENTD
jgi:hypothetical protein